MATRYRNTARTATLAEGCHLKTLLGALTGLIPDPHDHQYRYPSFAHSQLQHKSEMTQSWSKLHPGFGVAYKSIAQAISEQANVDIDWFE
jgi:hypothetical protein